MIKKCSVILADEPTGSLDKKNSDIVMSVLHELNQQGKTVITFNEYLLKADIRCIQYVVLHELTHLLYPNHSKAFYDFLTVQMPDWKERKKQLDTEVVQGL